MTRFKFWLLSNETEEEHRSEIVHPSAASIVKQLSSLDVRTQIYPAQSAWYDLAHSFGVYINSTVLSRDLRALQHTLSALWNDTCQCYVKFLLPEFYFSPSGCVSCFCCRIKQLSEFVLRTMSTIKHGESKSVLNAKGRSSKPA